MTAIFADTSALAKRYVVEVGTQWLRTQVKPSAGNVIIIAATTRVEMYSLLARRQRDGSIAASAAARLRRAFLRHARIEYLVFPLDDPVLVRARNLVTKYPLRTLDSIQLACALEASAELGEPITFVSGDNSLLAVASLEGFSTDDPYAHP